MIYGIFFIFAGYLSGSILFAYLIPKYFYHIDICRLSDDQNPGAFNAFAHTGIKTGTLILLLELAKGFFPVHIALACPFTDRSTLRTGSCRTGDRTCLSAFSSANGWKSDCRLLWVPAGTLS